MLLYTLLVGLATLLWDEIGGVWKATAAYSKMHGASVRLVNGEWLERGNNMYYMCVGVLCRAMVLPFNDNLITHNIMQIFSINSVHRKITTTLS